MMGQSWIRMIDGERHRVCGKCGECLPDTEEFYYYNEKRDGFRSPCKACIQEKRYATNVAKTCCVPGCTNPRYVTRTGVYRNSRCWEHRYHEAVTKPRKERLKMEGKRG